MTQEATHHLHSAYGVTISRFGSLRLFSFVLPIWEFCLGETGNIGCVHDVCYGTLRVSLFSRVISIQVTVRNSLKFNEIM